MLRSRPLDPKDGVFEPTGTKWQDSHFAQPKVARRVTYMDVRSESIHGVP